MLEGVQKELGKSEIKTKGHYTVKGVGNTPVTVYDECRTSIPLLDGSRQAVDAWTVNQVTATLTTLDLSRAEIRQV